MQIAIIGLGLIGGSLAKALKENTEHTVIGFDRDENTLLDALSLGAIDSVGSTSLLENADVVYVCLYPADVVRFVEENAPHFKEGCIVTDVCGIKNQVCGKLTEIAKNYPFVYVGGHPMAAGFSLPEDKVDEFRRRLNEHAKLTEEDFNPKIWIDVAMPLEYINESLIEELELLEPFGQGNEKPQFAQKGMVIRSSRVMGKNRNVVKLYLVNERGRAMDAVGFTDGDEFVAEMGRSRMMDVMYYPSVNEYNGNRTLQFVVKNWKFR